MTRARKCIVPGCQRRQSKRSTLGLCRTCHGGDPAESPDVLTGGSWIKSRHGIRRWVAIP